MCPWRRCRSASLHRIEPALAHGKTTKDLQIGSPEKGYSPGGRELFLLILAMHSVSVLLGGVVFTSVIGQFYWGLNWGSIRRTFPAVDRDVEPGLL